MRIVHRKEEHKPEEQWSCLTCREPRLDWCKEEFLKHLREVHGISVPVQGNRHWSAHLDAEDQFIDIYHWTIQNVEASQQIVCKRSEEERL